jgi:hypothetical protein
MYAYMRLKKPAHMQIFRTFLMIIYCYVHLFFFITNKFLIRFCYVVYNSRKFNGFNNCAIFVVIHALAS